MIQATHFPRICFFLILVCLCCAGSAHAADDSSRISTNPNFADGLKGWKTQGDVHLVTSSANPAKHVVTIGPGAGSILQRITEGAANHMMIAATLHSVPAGGATVSVRCLDKDGGELMMLRSPVDIKPSKEADTLEDYFRPHPLTASVEISISNDGTGTVAVDHLELDVYHDDDPVLQSTQDTVGLMRPFWKGSLVSSEGVLLTSRSGEPATGTLMFRPTRILSVTSYDGAMQYREGADYSVQGRTLIAGAGSAISQLHEPELLKGDLAWNVIGGKQVLVSYEHDDAWTGPVQLYVGDQLPNTMQILRTRGSLRIVAYGDSITYGLGSSHMQKLRPYQPPWVNLFAGELRKQWNDPDIVLYNASQSGADSTWAKNMAGRMVASLHPDLVLIAFGQNDFWSISPDAFAANIAGVMRTIRQTNPQAEFLLVPTMRFDPAYTTNPEYWKTVSEYEARLRSMVARGVQLVDMTAISGAVFAAKAPRDCLNDPLHPNDYLSRWYAQSLVAALAPEAGKPVATADAHDMNKKGVGDDDPDAPQAIDAMGSHWYYNWKPGPSRGLIRAEFVPMLWGAGNVQVDFARRDNRAAKSFLSTSPTRIARAMSLSKRPSRSGRNWRRPAFGSAALPPRPAVHGSMSS